MTVGGMGFIPERLLMMMMMMMLNTHIQYYINSCILARSVMCECMYDVGWQFNCVHVWCVCACMMSAAKSIVGGNCQFATDWLAATPHVLQLSRHGARFTARGSELQPVQGCAPRLPHMCDTMCVAGVRRLPLVSRCLLTSAPASLSTPWPPRTHFVPYNKYFVLLKKLYCIIIL